MLRVLHIARSTTRAGNATIAAMAREPGLSLWLVRPPDPVVAQLGRRARFGGLRTVPCWWRSDPHRGLHATLGFGMRQASPDIVHAQEEPDSLAALQVAAARRMAAPSARLVLHTWQNVNRPKRPHVRAVLAASLRAADAVLCSSDAAVDVLRAQGYRGITRVILQAGLDRETFHPGAPRGPAITFTVGYVGRLVPEKGLHTLVAAVARLGEGVALTLAGAGPMREALARQARRDMPGGSLAFAGQLDADGVASFLRRIDVLVLPSRTTTVWAEQFGRVLAEAMACGTPVVGSDSGVIPSVIGEAGLVFPQGDAGALAERLDTLRRSPRLRAACSERGPARATQLYSAETIAAQTAAFYRELAAAPPGAGR